MCLVGKADDDSGKKDKERPARERGSMEQGAPEHTHCSSPQQCVVLR